MNPSLRSLFIPILAVCATAILSVILFAISGSLNANTWQNLDLAKAATENEYCEYNQMDSFIRQSSNSWSNIFYFFLGIWVVGWGVADLRKSADGNPQQRFPAMTMWVGFMLVGLCFGSFFFHASLTMLGQHWGMGFTYGLSLSLVFASGYRLCLELCFKENNRLRWIFLVGAIVMTILFFVLKWQLNGKVALPIVMLIGLVNVLILYFRERKKWNGWLLLAGFINIISAAVFRAVDVAKIACDPETWLQLHALWHCCTGITALLFLAFLRGEKT